MLPMPMPPITIRSLAGGRSVGAQGRGGNDVGQVAAAAAAALRNFDAKQAIS